MVKCKQCGGPHPVWECHATAAKIAAYRGTQSSVVLVGSVFYGGPTSASPCQDVGIVRSAETVHPIEAHLAQPLVETGNAILEGKRRGRPISPSPKSKRAAYQRELMRKRRAK